MALVPFPHKTGVRATSDDEDPDRDAANDDGDDLDDPDGDSSTGKMSFLSHLDELRKRIVWSVVGVLVGFVISFTFINEIFDFIMRPMQEMLPSGGTLIYTDPTEAFMLYIKIALIAGLILASPLVFWQVWLFIAPGLYQNEKKLAIPFVLMSTFFFVGGAAFSHYIVFPLTWRFFVGFTNELLTFTPRVEPAFAIYLRLILALGITFQLPTVVLFLARMGMITARFMIRHIKYAALLIILASAVLSPDGNGVGMLAMGGPVFILYIFSIGLAWLFAKKKRVETDAS